MTARDRFARVCRQGWGGVGRGRAGSDGAGSGGAEGRRFCPTDPGAGEGSEAAGPPPDEVGGSSSTSPPPFPAPVKRVPVPGGPACACGFDASRGGSGVGLASVPGEGRLDGPRAGRGAPPPGKEGKPTSTASQSATTSATGTPTPRTRRHMPTDLL